MSTAAVLEAGLPAAIRRSAARGETGAAPAQPRMAELAACRPLLMRYARRVLRNVADAEDAVQAALLAALDSPRPFDGRSSINTWLHGILKHKITDIFRRQAREPLREEHPENELREEFDALFDADGHWREAPSDWGNPEALLERRDFSALLDDCLARLPRSVARVFTMRELMDLEISQICDQLDITPNNCSVQLHRARMKLRGMLEQRWFAPQA